jgi:transcriptional regulator with XRE-family HTH domain
MFGIVDILFMACNDALISAQCIYNVKPKSEQSYLMNAAQCRMARAALQLGVRDLAKMAKVSPATVVRLEASGELRERTVDALRAALESAGVEFTNGDQPGVRLRKQPSGPTSIAGENLNASNDE